MFTLNYKINYFNAIACCMDEKGVWSFKKYHSIKNEINRQSAFIDFIKTKFPSCQYINFYNKETKRFYERIYTT